tara:strand:- start:19281 stop:19709 length:429 start_codon:yes stop_codon:yes gene_type:complete
MATDLNEMLGSFNELDEFNTFKILALCVNILRLHRSGNETGVKNQLELISSALTEDVVNRLKYEWNADVALETRMSEIHADFMVYLAELQASFLTDGAPYTVVDILEECIDARSLLHILVLFMSFMDAPVDFEKHLINQLKD